MLAARLARLSRRQRLVLVGMLVSCAVVVMLATILVVATPTTGGTAKTAGSHPPGAKTQPLTLTGLPAPSPANTAPGTWGPAAPAFAQTVAFATASPATAWVCGVTGGTVQLASTHDGGQTWAAYRASVAGQACAISISPATAQTIALTISQCAGTCAANAPAALYRSSDGGQHWAQATLPTGGGFGGVLGWSGTTLYATTNDPLHPLAVSVGGAAFALRDDITRFSGQIAALGASGGSICAVLRATPTGTATPANSAPLLVQSGNDGVVWSLVSLSDAPFVPTFVQLSADGTLLALEGADTLVASRTLGATWQSAAPFTAGQTLGGDRFAARTPDGTLVALLQATSGVGKANLAILASGTRTWQPLAAPPAGARLVALTWNAAGHPATLWASMGGHLIILSLSL